jgi:hypothetical protein
MNKSAQLHGGIKFQRHRRGKAEYVVLDGQTTVDIC